MDEKQAPPPSYSDASSYNAGYTAPQGDQGGNTAPNPYAPPPAGYPPAAQGYPPAGQAGYPPAAQGYAPAGQPGYPAGYGGQYAGQYGYHQQTVVMNQPVAANGMVINQVSDNMGLAIFVTICCCWPLGIVAIMRAQESRRALDRGDVMAASTYSQEARRYSMWAIAGGCVSIILCVVIIVVVVTQNTYYYSNSY